jgi:catechol 2,3-dioxygenase-like lactoylglutathione lyase family enzyme
MSMLQAKGILHFTISCRDHAKSAELYRDLLGCEILRISDKFAFMQCGTQHFVLWGSDDHVPPQPPDGTKFHHAFIVSPQDFDRARSEIERRGFKILKYEDAGHRSFPGRHLYFHDYDGNGIELFDGEGEEHAAEKAKAAAN